jgi:hypothetical protein
MLWSPYRLFIPFPMTRLEDGFGWRNVDPHHSGTLLHRFDHLFLRYSSRASRGTPEIAFSHPRF